MVDRNHDWRSRRPNRRHDGPLVSRSLAVQAINVHDRMARLSNGMHVPIVSLFDGQWERTDDGNEAVVFVCGSDTLRSWFNGRVDSFVRENEIQWPG